MRDLYVFHNVVENVVENSHKCAEVLLSKRA